jgi:predicted nucleic acid-binding protein
MGKSLETVVVTDANVFINLFKIGQVSLFGRLAGYRFLVPADVVTEITQQDQRETLNTAISAGILQEVAVDSLASLALFVELRAIMGRGEAACLALAATAGYSIASDEKKRFRRAALERLGERRIVRTEDLLILGVRQGCFSSFEADGFKEVLAASRYVMSIKSFQIIP